MFVKKPVNIFFEKVSIKRVELPFRPQVIDDDPEVDVDDGDDEADDE